MPIFALVLWLSIRWYGGLLGAGVAVVAKAFFDYAAFLYSSKLKPRSIMLNMAGHLVFLVIATVCADSMDSLNGMAAIAVALIAGNLAWSFCESSELHEVASCLRQRLLPNAG